MPEYAISLLVQIPLVGIFVWFTLEIMKRQERSNDRRDDQWREFLKDQAEQYNSAISRIAEEVKANTSVLQMLRDQIASQR